MNRAANVALAVVAALELAAAAYLVTHNDAPKNAAAVAPLTPRTTATQTPTTTPVTTASSSPSLGIDATSASRAARPVVAFLGDDWTLGTGASSKLHRFTTLVCARLGAREVNFGADGTGYAKSSDSGGPYRARVDKLVAAAPDVVVVSGGRNDKSDDAATAADDTEQLFATLRSRLPHAVLIAIAPFWGDSDLPPQMVALGDAVKQAVTDAGGMYVDLPDPIHGHPTLMADDADPNDEGYALIALALTPQLAPLLPR